MGKKKLTKKDIPKGFIKKAERILSDPDTKFVPLDDVIAEIEGKKSK